MINPGQLVNVWPSGAAAVGGGLPSAPAAPSAPQGFSIPPVLIGGVKCHNVRNFDESALSVVGVDWISGTVPHDKVESLIKYLTNFFQAVPEVRNHGQYRYDSSVLFNPLSIQVFFDSTEDRSLQVHSGRAMVVIPGAACGSLQADFLMMLIHDLVFTFWMKATRLDVCWDDYKRTVPIETIEAALEAGQVSGYRSYEVRKPKRFNGPMEGHSVLLGKRGQNGGGKYMRVYDKSLESKGEVNCIRWEVEYSKEKAQAVCFALAQQDTIEKFGVLVGAFVGGAVDFLVRKDKHLDRATRLDWWQGVRDLLGVAVLRGSKNLKVLEKTQEWIEKSVAPSLRMLVRACGHENVVDWISSMSGGGKISARQLGVVNDYLRRVGGAL